MGSDLRNTILKVTIIYIKVCDCIFQIVSNVSGLVLQNLIYFLARRYLLEYSEFHHDSCVSNLYNDLLSLPLNFEVQACAEDTTFYQI